jgi:hypothetical protein
MRAFVSHSSADDRYVAEMESFLRAAGFDEVFNDVSPIQPDEKFWPEIERGIANCDSFVVIITAASNSSEWVKREVEYARNLSKNIIPILIEDCVIPSAFADRDVIDLRPRSPEEPRYDISRIVKYAPAELIGRHDETKLLHDAWGQVLRSETQRPRILTFVALGGEGKTSVIAKWSAELAAQDWPGCDAAFAWGFYSQGTREQQAASSDLFLKDALNFFGDDEDKEFAAGNAGSFEKGQRLARIVGRRRNLLILDGLEPLQYATTATAFKPGELKDQGVAKLLKDLATNSHGLCIVTTRYSLPDLRAFWQNTAPEVKLLRLSRDAGVHLLKTLEVRGSERRNIPLDYDDPQSEKVNEFEKLVEDVKGHALTLQIMGGFLKRAFGGDIRQRDRVKFEKADEKMDGGHAFRTMAAYEQWLLRDGGVEGPREVAVLRLLSLFDRPADGGCLAALRSETITGLTEPLAGLADIDWEFCLLGLEAAKLLTVNSHAGAVISLDAHPHLREYFARQLRTQQPDAWRAAHRRLYEYLCASTKEGEQPTLEDLQPLYQAVAHGCQAGLQQEAWDEVYVKRILRGDENYSIRKLGAFVPDLGAVAGFFDSPWLRVSSSLTEATQAWVLNRAGLYLRALGRLSEAVEPMRAGVEGAVQLQDWNRAERYASNLSELELTLGEVAGAVGDAEQSVTYADRSGDLARRSISRALHAETLHQAGREHEAEARFREAERIQAETQPEYPLLYSSQGFAYCEFLISACERAAWKTTIVGELDGDEQPAHEFEMSWRAVYERATRIREWLRGAYRSSILDEALAELAVGRAVLYEAIHGNHSFAQSDRPLERALDGLRRAGQQQYIALGLLTRAWLRFLYDARTGSDSAQADLDEAWEIAERGPMRLVMADILLHRARLFGLSARESDSANVWTVYPWATVENDLASARKLIEQTGYFRRQTELADAEQLMRTPSNHRRANKYEANARKLVVAGDLSAAWSDFIAAAAADESRKTRLIQEFGFAYSFEGKLDATNPQVRQDAEALDWRRRVWSVLAKGNGAQIKHADSVIPLETVTTNEATKTEDTAVTTSNSATSEEKGDLLEKAVSKLFNTFFKMGDEISWKNRTQKRGTQSGYDLSLEWIGEVNAARPVRVHVECKNYSQAISHNEVGGKLLVEGIVSPPIIEHWILISPNTDPSNELNRFLESEQRNPKYPFDVQVWSPETGVEEFFGLEPEVHDQFYPPNTRTLDPRTWDEAIREAVRKKWMARLAPPLRLPMGWEDYFRDPAKLCTPAEDDKKFEETFENYVPLRCRNSAGALLEKPLETYVGEWLNQPDRPTLFLLGEFGDGKTWFTYMLARQLAGAWFENRQTGWLPLRLTLKRFAGNAREFLRQRLEEFKADVAGWVEMGKQTRRLVILDGFDEMSVKVGPAAVTKNIGDLISCVKEFNDCKILITSRTHFFENRQEAQRLMARLGNSAVYQLAPIGRREALRSTEKHLALTVGAEQARERLLRIDQMNDPIGLAGKPLFLEMLKVVLSSPKIPDDLNVLDLYEGYINQSLLRNDDRLEDGDFRTNPDEIIPNLRRILGALAEQLQRSGESFVSLSQFQARGERPLAELLWRLSGGDEMEKDALTRVGSRSLLSRVSIEGQENEWWVDFCHRSMREYFVAIRLCEAVEAGSETARKFLKEVPLNHEILQFATEHWRRTKATASVSESLLRLIDEAKPAKAPGQLGGYALTLLYRLNASLPRDRNWKGKVFDGADLEDADLSGMDFCGSSFVAANLANVNLEHTGFEGCDLTGVRLEETKLVVSLAASPSGDELIALYGDGVLRKWQAKSGSKMSSMVVASAKAEAGTVVGIHESGQAWLRTARQWCFLSQSGLPWSPEGAFFINEGCECISAKSGRIAISKKLREDLVELILFDLENQNIVGSMSVKKQALWCAALGDDAFIWSDSTVGFRVARLTSTASAAEIVLDMPLEPTCLDVWRCDSNEYLVSTGMGDGRILAWRVGMRQGAWSSSRLLETQAHQGAVTAVIFTSDSRVASGGSDRAIVLTRLIGTEHLAGMQERRLQRSLRCRGMQIKSVKGPAEAEMLRAFISQCEEEAS